MGRTSDRRTQKSQVNKIGPSKNKKEFKASSKLKRKPKVNLSKNLLAMKFMQRTKADHSGSEDESKDISSLESKGDVRFVIENSFEIIENLRCGRISFGGMNPELTKSTEKAKREADPTEDFE